MHNILIDIIKLIAAKRTEALEWVSKGAYSKGENTDTVRVALKDVSKKASGLISRIIGPVLQNSRKVPKIISKSSKGALMKIFELLNLVVIDNQFTCKAMEPLITDLIELIGME